MPAGQSRGAKRRQHHGQEIVGVTGQPPLVRVGCSVACSFTSPDGWGSMPAVVEETPGDDGLHARMATLREDNSLFWADCVKEGLTESVPVRLIAGFVFESEQQRSQLTSAVRELGYTVVREETHQQLGRPVLTELLFKVPSQTWTLGGWDEWAERMVHLGADCGRAMFNGIASIEFPQKAELEREQDKRHQRDLNVKTWEQLQNHGVTIDTPLALDAQFWVKDGTRAHALAAHLADAYSYATHVQPPLRRFLRQRTPWSVTGTTPPRTTNPDDLDAWTDQMVEVAHQHDVEFDGWGTLHRNNLPAHASDPADWPCPRPEDRF